MSDHSEIEQNLIKNEELLSESDTNNSSIPCIGNDEHSGGSSTSNSASITKNEKSSEQLTSEEIISKDHFQTVPGQTEGLKRDGKKQKNFIRLPTDNEIAGPSCIPENMGDDISKKEELHIVCECEPNVAGAAVPTVISFVEPEPCKYHTETADTALSSIDNSTISSDFTKNKDTVEKIISLDQNEDEDQVDVVKSDITSEIGKRGDVCSEDAKEPQDLLNHTLNVVKSNKDSKAQTRRPSLIPKPTKVASVNKKREYSSEKTLNQSTFKNKLNAEGNESKAPCKDKSLREPQLRANKNLHKPIKQHNDLEYNKTASNTISSRMTDLQDRLKATTSMLRQKNEMDKSNDQSMTENINEHVSIEGIKLNANTTSKITVKDLYRNISELKNTVSSLSESSTFSGQKKYIEKLFINISEIKNIANRLGELEHNPVGLQSSEHNQVSLSDEAESIKSSVETFLGTEKARKSSVNSKENIIHIKFTTHDGKKKKTDGQQERSEEIQTDLSLGLKLTSESLNSKTNLVPKIKEADSLDGVFIPTYEPPVNIEEEDETNGLDITITFPEFELSKSNEAESSVPVCLSDISAEALRKLKRCPKEFKLLMDFVEGKVSFQSGAGPTNNFSIGPNLKFIESAIDEKKSDVIDIKLSTECLYSSQLIPVENPEKPKNSTKSLKSTDSELFNVVNLPFLYRNPYLDDSSAHKSCITFKNDKLLSVALLARQFFKSMPQIPSLTNIFEEGLVDNFSKTALQNQDRKRKSRQYQRKRFNSNTTL